MCKNRGHHIDGLHRRLILLHHMPSTLSQLRQKLYSLHCCICSKIKRWMLVSYVILRVCPRLILFSLWFLILPLLLLIIHHYCLLEHPSGLSYWVAIVQATSASKFCQCFFRGPGAFLPPLHWQVGPSDFPLLECPQRESHCQHSLLASSSYRHREVGLGSGGAC